MLLSMNKNNWPTFDADEGQLADLIILVTFIVLELNSISIPTATRFAPLASIYVPDSLKDVPIAPPTITNIRLVLITLQIVTALTIL